MRTIANIGIYKQKGSIRIMFMDRMEYLLYQGCFDVVHNTTTNIILYPIEFCKKESCL